MTLIPTAPPTTINKAPAFNILKDVFVTADPHWAHRSILKHDGRPFETIEEHDEVTVQWWNETVPKRSTVYLVGDVCWSKKKLEEILKRLNGKIHLIRGNHDDDVAWRMRASFQSAREAAYVRIDKRYQMYLSHYKHVVWRGSHKGAYHFYGHSHGALEGMEFGRSGDVGFPVRNYRPASLEELVEQYKDRPFVDHHELYPPEH